MPEQEGLLCRTDLPLRHGNAGFHFIDSDREYPAAMVPPLVADYSIQFTDGPAFQAEIVKRFLAWWLQQRIGLAALVFMAKLSKSTHTGKQAKPNTKPWEYDFPFWH